MNVTFGLPKVVCCCVREKPRDIARLFIACYFLSMVLVADVLKGVFDKQLWSVR